VRSGGGKQKGNAFERTISVKLSKWLTENIMDNAIWRTDTSGGRSTTNIKRNNINEVVKDNIGDLKQVAGIDKFPDLDLFFITFFVELKIGYGDAFTFTLPLNKTLREIIDKCIEQSKIVSKDFCLIVKPDRRKEMLITQKFININFENMITFKYNNRTFFVYLLDDIIKFKFKDLIGG